MEVVMPHEYNVIICTISPTHTCYPRNPKTVKIMEIKYSLSS